MYTDLVQPAGFIINIVKFFGLWRLDNRWQPLYRIYSFVLHFIFTFQNIATMWASVFTSKDLGQFTESLYMALTEVALMAKVINMFNFNEEAVAFFRLVEGAAVGAGSEEEIGIFKTAHRTFGMVGKFYISASACVVGVVYAVAALGRKNVLPYPAWMPFDMNSENYWYAYSFQLMGLIVTCSCNVSIDMLQCYYLHHLSLIYRVVGYRLSKIGFGIEEGFPEHDVNRVVIAQLKQTIKIHQFAKRLTTKCERLTSFPFFMQVLLSALVLCFTGYQLQDMSPLENPVQFVGTADFLLVMGLQIFLPCYYANQVTIESGQLSEALYNSNWVALPQKSRKIIYLHMQFLRDPMYIKTGKFFNIGIPIFAKTINNAYSYFAVLIRMKN